MFIAAVDDALRAFLRTRLPLPADAGDVSFDAPSPEWAAALTRPTVSLFLERVDKSDSVARAPQRRFDANGRPERRTVTAQLVDLTYVLSVWAPDAATEHHLLGRAVSVFAATPALAAPTGPLAVSLGSAAAPAPFALGGPIKAFATITVTACADPEAEQEPMAASATSTTSITTTAPG